MHAGRLVLICSLAAAAGVGGQQTLPGALRALVETERTFAQTAREKGVRDSFLAFFADDAIGFRPDLGNAKAQLRALPAPPSAPATLLVWEPRYGDISRAGDLGYLTGPFSVLEKASGTAKQHGCFFSIWQQQPAGVYRVKIDFGIVTPAPPVFASGFTAAPDAASDVAPPAATRDAARGAILDADRALASAAQSHGVTQAYATWMAAAARLHRDGKQPLTSPEEIQKYLSESATKLSWTVVDGDASSSADLGYTYGRYANGTEKGFYVRMWRRQAEGSWRITVDTMAPSR